MLLVPAGSTAAGGDEWPRVRDAQASFGIDSSAERILIVLPIYNYDNEEEYRVVCIGGSTEYTDRLSAETGQNFVGGLTCHLRDHPRVYTEDSLLAEDSSPAWHTRGVFRYPQLIGDCGDYPEYGRVRHFRLRGFELTLAVDGVVESDELPWVEDFVLNISVREDRSIRSGHTEQPGYLRPRSLRRRNRDGIIRGS